jgi:hypothetical protein
MEATTPNNENHCKNLKFVASVSPTYLRPRKLKRAANL